MKWRDFSNGLRGRISVAVALFGALTLLAQVISLILAFEAQEEAFIDELLGQQIEYSMRTWHAGDEQAFPNTPDMRLIRIPAGGALPADIPPGVAQLPVGNHEVDIHAREHHVAVRQAEEGRFILLYDVSKHEARLDNLFADVVGNALLLLAVLLVGSYFLAGGLSRRFERLAAQVAKDDAQKLVEPGMPTEARTLAEAIERARARQRLAIERERAFAANLSHELRTPLTAIRTDAELIGTEALPPAPLRRSQRIMDNVDRIQATASSLLMLARDMVPRECVVIPLRADIEAVWASLVSGPAEAFPTLEVTVSSSVRVMADPALLELVLRNLLENAIQHSAHASVSCVFEGSTLSVQDGGPGFPPAAIAQIFERFYSGRSGGNGLGLAMVAHVCQACGWTPGACNRPAGGAEVSIDFGSACITGVA